MGWVVTEFHARHLHVGVATKPDRKRIRWMVVIININSMHSGVRALSGAWLLLSCLGGQSLPKFMGRQVIIVKPERIDEFFPKGPASVCLEGPPPQQCYTAPKDFGNNPTVSVVQLQEDMPALFFSAASGGVSGWQVHFALLRPGPGNDLEDLFPGDEMTVSNQSQHAFWNDPAISKALIFLTADFVWGAGPNESQYEPHYDGHRYMISAYVLRRSTMIEALQYYLDDRYMTVRKYDYNKADILASEKPEILARLRRLKSAH